MGKVTGFLEYQRLQEAAEEPVARKKHYHEFIAHLSDEEAKVQGAHDAVVFLTMVASSLSSGYMLDRNGWHTLNYLALPLITLAGCAVLWLFLTRRTAVAA